MKRILFIDDNRPFRHSFSRILENAGYTVEQAENGRAALSKFKDLRPDLVVCDLIMPDVEGLETMRAIHKVDGSAKIIAISGGGRVNALDYLKLASMLGAVATLAKPFSREELIDVVDRSIGPGVTQPPDCQPGS